MYISSVCTLPYSRLDIDALWFKLVASTPLSLEPTTLCFTLNHPLHSHIISIPILILILTILDPSRYSLKPTSLLLLSQDSSELLHQHNILVPFLCLLCTLCLSLLHLLQVHSSFLIIWDL